MTKILNFALKIKRGGREGGTCEVFRPCHPPKKKVWKVHHFTCSDDKHRIEFDFVIQTSKVCSIQYTERDYQFIKAVIGNLRHNIVID